MKILLKLAVIVLLVMGATLLYSPAPALACAGETLAPGVTNSPTNRTKNAEVVLEGIVTETLQNSVDIGVIAKIEVTKYYKNSGISQISISGYAPAGSDCDRDFVQVGKHLIFYASGDANKGFRVSFFSAFNLTDKPEPAIIREIIAATGQQPTLPTDVTPTVTPPIATPTITAPTPTPSITKQPEASNSNWLWVGLGAVVILGGGFFLLTKRRRWKFAQDK